MKNNHPQKLPIISKLVLIWIIFSVAFSLFALGVSIQKVANITQNTQQQFAELNHNINHEVIPKIKSQNIIIIKSYTNFIVNQLISDLITTNGVLNKTLSQKYQQVRFMNTGHISIIQKSNIVTTTYNDLTPYDSIIADALNRESEGEVKVNQVSKYIHCTPLQQYDYIVCSSVQTDELNFNQNNLKRVIEEHSIHMEELKTLINQKQNSKFIYILMIIILFSLGFAYILYQLLSYPLKQIDNIIQKLAHFEFDTKIDVSNQKEFGRIFDGLSDIQKKFGHFYTTGLQKIDTLNENLEKKSNHLRTFQQVIIDSEIHAEKVRLENEELKQKLKPKS